MKKSIAASAALYASCFILHASCATLSWNGADGAGWSDEGVWLDESSAAATYADGDDVVFPATASAKSVNLTAVVKPESVTFNGGEYTLTGSGLIGDNSNTPIAINAGTVTFNCGDQIKREYYTIAEGATMVMRESLWSAKSTYHSTFKGAGTLIVDGCTLDMSANGAYVGAIASLTGRLVLRNGAKVQGSSNSNQSVLGSENLTVVFSGSDFKSYHDGSKFVNNAFELVAGTTNTMLNNEVALDLSKMTIVEGETLDADTVYTLMTINKTSGAPSVCDSLANAGWGVILETNESSQTVIKLHKTRTLTWGSVANATWTTENAWLVGETAATFQTYDDVVFPANASSETITVPETVKPASVTVNGMYLFAGEGAIDVASVSVDGGDFGIGAANIYSGAVAYAGATNRVAITGEVTLGTMTVDTNSYLFVDSGKATITSIPRQHYQVAEGATLVMQGSYSQPKSDAYNWCKGAGAYVLDGATIDMSNSGTYSAFFRALTGTLRVQSGAKITFGANNNMNNLLGTGKFVFAGGTITRSSTTGYTFGNSAVELVAGTENTVSGQLEFPLDKATITDEGIELDHHKTYALLTAGKNSSNQATLKDADKLTVPASLKSKGWRVRTVTSDDGDTTVELYCQRGLFILIR